MHFDQRTQAALRAVGLTTDELQTASADVAERTADDADALMTFFETNDVVYSDMDMAHSASEYPEHTVEYCDITTHAAEMRGWLRFDTWGVYVEDGRILDDGTVELTLGPSVHDRVRFAATREKL
ncbi:DUF7532 family protein [Haloarchaeobius sp. TZWWS8]|uniref:DUF7532 family protein n=1 Tax=Haloarchaeobius sp. TZWWS8 TaxID=3446121 RepID=UPI003EB9B80C